MQEALQVFREAKSYRLVGSFLSPSGDRTAFDAHVDSHGSCKGNIGGADSVLVGQKVWTRWSDALLDEAVATLTGKPAKDPDPVAPIEEDSAWAATKLLRGSYMVTDLPAEMPQLEGIAPVCRAGELLIAATDDDGEVITETVVERGGERLQPIRRTYGPVTVRVYLPEEDVPQQVLADYQVEGGRSFSFRFTNPGEPLAISPPNGEQEVSSEDVMAVLRGAQTPGS
jgi:hypothetical protein